MGTEESERPDITPGLRLLREIAKAQEKEAERLKAKREEEEQEEEQEEREAEEAKAEQEADEEEADEEVFALAAMVDLLAALNERAQLRVIDYLASRFLGRTVMTLDDFVFDGVRSQRSL